MTSNKNTASPKRKRDSFISCEDDDAAFREHSSPKKRPRVLHSRGEYSNDETELRLKNDELQARVGMMNVKCHMIHQSYRHMINQVSSLNALVDDFVVQNEIPLVGPRGAEGEAGN
mmetsp:Transcript_5389/g.20123  ORF Transcript_5389/g.20123 Transcript_5389/m.20123 type:complete len:116 (+) Transcript_5389:827-1174(+)